MKRTIFSHAIAIAVSLGLASTAFGVDYPIAAKAQVIKQDSKAGFVAKLAKIVNKPFVKGTTFTLPSDDPTVVGATLRFFRTDAATASPDIALPAAGWSGLGNPAGSKGWKYKGAGSGADPCKVVIIKEKVIKAVCKGPGAFESPSPYSVPIGLLPSSANWDLVLGSDRYCAASNSSSADIKKDDGAKGLFKAVKASAPAACPSCGHDVCTEGTPLLTACSSCAATVCAADPFCCNVAWDALCIDEAVDLCGECGTPYGSTSRAFVTQPFGLLR